MMTSTPASGSCVVALKQSVVCILSSSSIGNGGRRSGAGAWSSLPPVELSRRTVRDLLSHRRGLRWSVERNLTVELHVALVQLQDPVLVGHSGTAAARDSSWLRR